MSSGSSRQDIPFLLFLVPFAISTVYALYLWATTGISAVLPSSVFLQVTENPYVFLVGFVAVMAAAALDIQFADPANRRTKLLQESSTLQKVAVVALILGLVSAWYAAGFDLGGAAANVAAGRYVIVFPALVILFSFLILPSVTVRRDQLRNVVIVLLLLAVPLAVDEIGKRDFFAGMGAAVALLALALYLYLTTKRRDSKSA
jgi:hypothetical protein